MVEPEQVAGIVKSLTKGERAAVQGRFAWTSPQEQDEGEARLYQLGLWNPRPKRNERLLTDLGLAVRSALKENDRGE